MNAQDRNRHPAGVAAGGQFATEPRTEPEIELAPGGQDWLDDAERFAGEGAFVTITGDDGTHTDFQLDADELEGAFGALARGAAPARAVGDWADDVETFAEQGAFVTVTGDSGEYTDFQLDADQVQTFFDGVSSGT